jgi:hypothetical protein
MVTAREPPNNGSGSWAFLLVVAILFESIRGFHDVINLIHFLNAGSWSEKAGTGVAILLIGVATAHNLSTLKTWGEQLLLAMWIGSIIGIPWALSSSGDSEWIAISIAWLVALIAVTYRFLKKEKNKDFLLLCVMALIGDGVFAVQVFKSLETSLSH